MIPYYYFGLIVPRVVAMLLPGDGLIFTDMSRLCIAESCVSCAQETRRFSHMSMSSSQSHNSAITRSMATIILELWIRAVSRVTLSVDSAKRDFTAMMSCIRTVGTIMKSAIYAIEGTFRASNNITRITTPWSFISGTNTFYAQTRNAWIRNLSSLNQRWTSKLISLKCIPMICQKM